MKITALTENTSARCLPTEHGLSLFIEACGKKLLFDMGQTGLFAENAAALGIDLKEAELAVISHGHYDHGGGLETFLKLNKTAPVYISTFSFEPHYNAHEKYIGLDTELKNDPRLIFVSGKTSVGEGLTLYDGADIPQIVDMGAAGLTVMESGRLILEDFRHEQYLLIEENGKRVLISGCSHRGIINITEHFRSDILIGGFHFMKLSPGDTLASYAKRLDSYPTRYFTCHCTGTEQYDFMRPIIKHLNYISAGDSITI